TALIGKRLMRVVRLRETLIRAAFGFSVGVLGSFFAWLHLRFFDPMFLREGSADNYRRRFGLDGAGDATRTPHAVTPHQHSAPPAHEPARVAAAGPAAAPPQTAPVPAEPVPAEVVGAGVEVSPRAAADAAGNGHAKESAPARLSEGVDIKDAEERQN
ncbi:MAG TPA: hypothetical protein VF591_25760, partial [Pyrinomonadaceae bacterium]